MRSCNLIQISYSGGNLLYRLFHARRKPGFAVFKPNDMRILYNIFFPLPGFSAMMLFGTIFARRSAKPLSARTINHEAIHKAQALADFKKGSEKRNRRAWFRYYAAYLRQWMKYGYRAMPFEREAYDNAGNLTYLETRPANNWKQYVN